MKKYSVLAVFLVFISGIIAISSCEQSTSTNFEESFQEVKEVTPIKGAQNVTMDLAYGDTKGEDSYFVVDLGNGISKEGWCVEWNEESIIGSQEGTRLFSTKGKEAWKELNYFMGIKNDLRANDPSLTYKEIQVVIWSLIDNPSFDVDNISTYENISERIYKDGEPQFNVQKVKDIVSQVNNHFNSANPAKRKDDTDDSSYAVFVDNDGQTVMVKDETAYAYSDDYATCFMDINNLSGNKWGWSNGPLGEGEYEFDMYAGAGQCDLSNGTLVGKLLINYSDGTADVTFQMTETSDFTDELYTMTTTHLYIGDKILPMKDDSYTDAPGQYGNVDSHDNATEYSYTINDLSGNIYVVGHADVNGFEGEEED